MSKFQYELENAANWRKEAEQQLKRLEEERRRRKGIKKREISWKEREHRWRERVAEERELIKIAQIESEIFKTQIGLLEMKYHQLVRKL